MFLCLLFQKIVRMPRINIYFCGSMRAGRQDVDLYGILVDKLQQEIHPHFFIFHILINSPLSHSCLYCLLLKSIIMGIFFTLLVESYFSHLTAQSRWVDKISISTVLVSLLRSGRLLSGSRLFKLARSGSGT
jgi:hypothetical protein